MATHKSISEPSYGVHRPTDDGPSSSHPSREEEQEAQEDHRSTTPPPYSGPTTSTMSIPRPRPSTQKHYPGLPKLDYKLYCPRNFTLYKDQTTLKSSDPLLSTDPKELVALIQQLATVPPKPQIRIRGTSPGGTTVHFDLKINMMGLIVPDDREKKSMNYVRIIAPGEKGWRGEIRETIGPNVGGGLEEWARLFCRDPAAIKQFTLQRIVTNWDTNYLEGRLLSLISSTSYKGHTEITFPITHTHVTIKSPDKVNRFFSNVTSLFTGVKRYEIVKSVWPYADTERSFASSGGGFAGGRTCCVQSEDNWFEEWKDCIRYAVLGRRNGWVTGEDRLEVLMEPRGDEGVKPEEWGTS